MVTASWYKLRDAINKAIPCAYPVEMGPWGGMSRCNACYLCEDHSVVEGILAVVESEVEHEIMLAEMR